jgi:hypothetical protein
MNQRLRHDLLSGFYSSDSVILDLVRRPSIGHLPSENCLKFSPDATFNFDISVRLLQSTRSVVALGVSASAPRAFRATAERRASDTGLKSPHFAPEHQHFRFAQVATTTLTGKPEKSSRSKRQGVITFREVRVRELIYYRLGGNISSCNFQTSEPRTWESSLSTTCAILITNIRVSLHDATVKHRDVRVALAMTWGRHLAKIASGASLTHPDAPHPRTLWIKEIDLRTHFLALRTRGRFKLVAYPLQFTFDHFDPPGVLVSALARFAD